MKKRWISLFLALVMLLSISPAAYAVDEAAEELVETAETVVLDEVALASSEPVEEQNDSVETVVSEEPAEVSPVPTETAEAAAAEESTETSSVPMDESADPVETPVPSEEPVVAQVTEVADEVVSDSGETVIDPVITTYVSPYYADVIDAAELEAYWDTYVPVATYSETESVTVAEATAALRSAMVDREAGISFSISADTYDEDTQNALASQIFDAAMAHTGVGKQGDYIAFNGTAMSAEVGATVYSDNSCVYNVVMVMTYFTDAEQEAAVDAKVASILSELDLSSATDYEKVCGIYDYICSNVTYDYDHLEDSEYTLQFTAYAALINGTSVCQGYALTFYRLALELGVDARIIAGDSGGAHSWNIVKLGDYYYNVDSTWDAGSSEYSWFLLSDGSFTNHTRYDEYSASSFTASYPMAATDYDTGESGGSGDSGEEEESGFEGASGTCDNGFVWEITADGVLTITGEGAMADYSVQTAPWYEYQQYVTKAVISDGITYLGDYALAYMYSLESVSIPESVAEVGDCALHSCSKLLTAGPLGSGCNIEYGWTAEIPDHAFYQVSYLESVTFPDTITSIGAGAFGYTSLQQLDLPEGISIVPEELCVNNLSLQAVTIPEGVVEIQNNAFSSCCALETVSLPATLTTIGEGAFYTCEKLTALSLPDSLSSMGMNAFLACKSLKSATIPASLTEIPSSAFGSCESMAELVITDGVSVIGNYAFMSNDALTEVIIPASVTEIGITAFDCANLSKITFQGDAPTFGNNPFLGVTATVYYPADNVTWTEEVRASYGGTLTWVAYCSEHVEVVDEAVAATCTATGLTAGSHCSVCGETIVAQETIPVNDHTWDSGTVTQEPTATETGEVLYTCTVCDATKTEEVPGLSVPASGTCGENLTWTLDEDYVLTISGTGEMYDYSIVSTYAADPNTETAPWTGYAAVITSVVIADGVTSIGDYAFYNCTAMKSVSLSDSVASIGDSAFAYCDALESVTIPAGVSEIGICAFFNCSGLTAVHFAGDAPTIGESAFMYVTADCTYPKGNETWTEDVLQNYDGTLSWEAVCTDHVVVIDAAVAATCTETGLTEGSHCSVCDEVLAAQEVVDALGHTAVVDAAVAPDCTETGLTEGSHCFVCGEVFVAQEIVDALGHTAVVDAAVAPDCTETGLTEGSHCSVCNEVLVAQEILDALGHDTQLCNVKDATVTERGYTGDEVCTVCGETVVQGVAIPMLLTIKAQPVGVSAYAGEKVKFSVTATGEDLTYQWQYKTASGTAWKNATSTGAKTKTLTVSAASGLNGCQYRCVITDGSGNTVTSKAVKLTVVVFKIRSQPVSEIIVAGKTAVFSVGVSGLGLTYQWQYRTSSSGSWKSTTAFEGAKTVEMSVPATTGRNGYQYRCKITDKTGAVLYSSAATLKVTGFKSQPDDVVTTSGTSVKFKVKATGDDLSYQWQYRTSANGTWKTSGSSGNKTATLKVKTKISRNGYQYRCRIKDSEGNVVYSDPATLYVTGIKTKPTSQTVVAGDTAVFTVVATGHGLTYQWQYRTSSSGKWKSTTAFEGAKTASMSVPGTTGRDGYQYRCKIKDSEGNVVYTSAATLHVTGFKSQPNDIVTKSGTSVKFKVKASGDDLSYQWQYRTSDSGTWKNSGSSGNKTATLKVSAKTSRDGYQYRCRIKDGEGNVVYSDAATLRVTGVKTKPASVTVVAGETAVFTVVATGPGLTYQWQYRTSSSGKWKSTTAFEGAKTASMSVPGTTGRDGYQYRCKIKDSKGNVVYTSAATLHVTGIKSHPSDVTAKSGASVKIKVKATGDDLSYQWQYRTSSSAAWKNSGSSGNKTATLKISAKSSRDGYQYRCKITDGEGNVIYSDAATLTVTS